MHAVHVDRLIAFGEPYLTRSSERQLLMYSMDKRVRFSILFIDFGFSKGLQRGAEFFFRLPHRLPKRLLIHYSSLSNNHRKVNCYWGCNNCGRQGESMVFVYHIAGNFHQAIIFASFATFSH